MKTRKRVAIVHAFFVLFAIALVARAAKVQVVEGKDWTARARRQHYFAGALSAPRGEILDASGNTLVESREMTRVAVALPEVRDTAFVLKALYHARVDADARANGVEDVDRLDVAELPRARDERVRLGGECADGANIDAHAAFFALKMVLFVGNNR